METSYWDYGSEQYTVGVVVKIGLKAIGFHVASASSTRDGYGISKVTTGSHKLVCLEFVGQVVNSNGSFVTFWWDTLNMEGQFVFTICYQ